MKTCFKCGVAKPLDDFYRHPQMADGRLGKCKACTKADVNGNYRTRHTEKREYDRERNKRPERKAAQLVTMQRARANRPERYAARHAVANAIRDGRLIRKPCEVCGDLNSEAHHPGYSRPLDVKWLCLYHHRAEHGALVQAAIPILGCTPCLRV